MDRVDLDFTGKPRRRRCNSTERSVFTFLTPGMLPKLKDLRRCAKKRSFAFALCTNLIGGLDPAAVREGRFDEKLGIYPPDPLSRAGRLLSQMDAYLDEEDVKAIGLLRPDNVQQRVLDVVKSTDGSAMEALAKAGWFKAPKPSDATGLKGNRLAPPLQPFAYLLNVVDGATCKKVPREANLKDPVGEGPTAILEFVQWSWIKQSDENLPTKINADEKLDDIFRKAYSTTTGDAKLTSKLVIAGRRNQLDRTHDTSSKIRK